MGRRTAQGKTQNNIAPVASPCTAQCSMDDRRELCTGCYRTLDEILHWSQLSAAKKRAVNAAAGERRAAVRASERR